MKRRGNNTEATVYSSELIYHIQNMADLYVHASMSIAKKAKLVTLTFSVSL